MTTHLLTELGASWHDWRPLDFDRLSVQRRREIAAGFAQLVRDDYGETPLLVIKDPRLCRLVPLFLDAMAASDISLAPVLLFRNPLEVIASNADGDLVKTPPYPLSDAALLSTCWSSRTTTNSATRAAGDVLAVVGYEALLADWSGAVGRSPRGTGMHFRFRR